MLALLFLCTASTGGLFVFLGALIAFSTNSPTTTVQGYILVVGGIILAFMGLCSAAIVTEVRKLKKPEA